MCISSLLLGQWSTEVLSFFELNIQEAVSCLVPFVNIIHHGVWGEDFFSIDEESDGGFLAQAHSLADHLVELDRLEVLRDQKSVKEMISTKVKHWFDDLVFFQGTFLVKCRRAKFLMVHVIDWDNNTWRYHLLCTIEFQFWAFSRFTNDRDFVRVARQDLVSLGLAISYITNLSWLISQLGTYRAKGVFA